MKINEDNQKNDYFFQDINTNNKTLTHKIFSYFYSLIQIKKSRGFLVYILMLIETIQFVSYAFTPPHYDSWKIEPNNIKLLSNIIGALRISTLMQFVEYNTYSIILYLLIIFIFIICLIIFFKFYLVIFHLKYIFFQLILLSK